MNAIITLPETTPLVFQWLPKQFGNSVPNNKQYQYLQRLINWARAEPQRTIYLVVNGAGLKLKQMKDLEETLSLIENIKVIDFNKIDFCTDDMPNLSIGSDFEISIPEFYKTLYSADIRMPFGLEIDLMRAFILLNFDKIAGQDEVIYFDFDIFSSKDNKKVGVVENIHGIVMAASLENSIIAIDRRGRKILTNALEAFVNELADKVSYCDEDNNMVWNAIRKEIEKLQEERGEDFDYEFVQFTFKGNVEDTSETSWLKPEALYKEPDLPISFNTSISQIGTTKLVSVR
ncbi:MAG: hypothetical protein QWI36_02450 [Wolbachia endosymbiont of Tyrophagus putrescentiae]|nr:hypothetical protein [Wolbachia endosymbiont of Tyrophagus putrescentiae]